MKKHSSLLRHRFLALAAALIWIAITLLGTRSLTHIPAERSFSEMQDTLFDLADTTSRRYGIVGAYVGLINGGRVEGHSIGYANAETERPIMGSTAFNVGSVSKPVTAWGILALAEDGRVDLDGPAADYLERWAFPETDYDLEEVTLRRLLRHTGGTNIHGYAGYERLDGPIEQFLRPLKVAPKDLPDQARTDYPITLIHPPGQARIYSGGGYALLQMLAEDVTGATFADYMRTRIFQPLGMSDTSFDPTELTTRSLGHTINGRPIPDMQFLALSATGLYISGDDVGAFLQAHISSSNPALEADTVAQLLEPTSVNESFAMGLTRQNVKTGTLYGHGGNNSSWHAQIYFIPETGNGFYFLTNTTTGAQWEIDLSCAWKSWATGQARDAKCDAQMSVVRQISGWAIALGLIAIVSAYATVRRMATGRSVFRIVPRGRTVFRTVVKYFGMVLLMVTSVLIIVIFFTDIIYWRSGVSFRDEIPVHEVRYLMMAICVMVVTFWVSIWESPTSPPTSQSQ